MPNNQASGNGQPGSRRHRSRHHGLRFENPARNSNSNDEVVRFGITSERPREPSPHYETHGTSSPLSSHHTTSSSRRAADGSETSMSQSDTRDYRYTSRHTTRNITRSPDRYDNNVPLSDVGSWIDNPPQRGRPQATYGYNGYNPTEYPRTLSGPDILGPPREAHRSNQHYIQPVPRVNGGGGPSRPDARLPRSRSRERYRSHADDRRERQNSRERYERRERREQRQYHETHAYSERRERYASPEPMFYESSGRRRRSRSNEPRYR